MKSNFMISVFLLCFSIQLITATTTTTNGKIPDIFLQYADNPDPPPSTDLAKMARYVMHYSGNKYYYTYSFKKHKKVFIPKLQQTNLINGSYVCILGKQIANYYSMSIINIV